MNSRSGRISIVIVGFRNPIDIQTCLKALSELSQEPAFDVFICENGGLAAFAELLALLLSQDSACEESSVLFSPTRLFVSETFPEIHCAKLRLRSSNVWIACSAYNSGYAGAINGLVNQLRLSSDWKGIWVLNPDTIPEPLALAKLVERAAAGGKGLVGSTIVNRDNDRIACRAGHSWMPSICRAITLGQDEHIGALADIAKVESALDNVSGASMYITRDCLDRIGPMDERFFLYYEDLDWSLRARPLGLGYAVDSVVRHKGGTTLGSPSVNRPNRSWLAVYLEFRNKIVFTRKHFPYYLAFAYFFSFLQALRYLSIGATEDFKTALEGLLAGARGECGPPARLPAEFLVRSQPSLPRIQHWRVKLAISAVYWLAICLQNWGKRLLGRPRKAWLTILYYHRVPRDYRYEFRRQMGALSRGANVVQADFRGVLPLHKKNVAITFDDAFSSVAENAVPELTSRSFPCTIFVPVGLLGTVPHWDVDDAGSTFQESVMTREQLVAVSSALVTLGSHSMNHSHLSQLEKASLQSEVEASRAELQRLTSAPVHTLAFPYGESNSLVLQVCQEAGFEFLYTTMAENIDPSESKMLRGRVRVDPWDGPIEFFLKFSGAYAWLSRVPRLLRTNQS